MAESITVSLILDDKEYTGKIQAAGKQAEDLGNKAKKAGDDGANSFNKFSSVAEILKGKMSGLATVLLGAGFAEMSRKSLALSDDISDLAKGTDVSILRILQLREAFAANGGNAEGLGKILNKLNISLYEAQDGSQQAQQALLKLGFSFKDIANLDTDQALQKVINKLASIQDPVERNALAFKTLGKEAKNIDWAGIAAGTTSTGSEMARYAEAIQKAGEAHDKLQAASEKLIIAFVGLLETTGILDFINSLSSDMAKFERIVAAAGLALAAFFGATIITSIASMTTAILGVASAFEALGVSMMFLEKGTAVGRLFALGTMLGVIVASYFGVNEILDKIDEKNKKKTEEAIAQQKTLEDARKKAAGGGDKPAVTPYYQKEIDQLDQISEIYARTNKEILDKLRFEASSVGLNSDELKIRQQLFDLDKARDKQLADINDKIRQERNSTDPIGSAAKIAQLEKEKIQVTDLYTTNREEIKKTMEATARQQRTFEAGWDKAWAAYKDSATNAAENAGRLFNKITQTMEDSLMNFFKTGKFGWKDFANTIIDEMMRIEVRKAISGIMPNFGSPSSGSSSGNIFTGLGNLLGFAGGTNSIPTNGPILVGERGPEILSGAAGRSVTPNSALGGSVTYNINAVDAMSFKQMIAADPQFLYAVSEQGRRRLPGGR
jgi:lambda family phage tail tape measure protein